MTVIHTREGHAPTSAICRPNKRWRSAQIGAEIGSAGPSGRILVRGEPGWEIVPEVAPVAGEVIIDKPGKGAFYATNLDLVLRTNGITHIILTGITTDVCVHTTMREANDRGYECVILSDCTGATDPSNHSAALHMVTMQGGVFGCVSTSELIRPLHRREPDSPHADDRPVATGVNECNETKTVDAEPDAYTFDPEHTALVDHRHAARLRRAGRLRRDPRQRRLACCRPSSRRCSGAGRAPAAGMTVIHTREGHVPDLSDCPPAKLTRGEPSHADRRSGAEGTHPRSAASTATTSSTTWRRCRANS